MPTFTFTPRLAARGFGKVTAQRLADRYEAAIRLERSRQQARECARFGFPVTNAMVHEQQDAAREYDAATAALH